MSLWGYKKKGGKAPWAIARDEAAGIPEKKPMVWPNRVKPNKPLKRTRVRHESKKRASEHRRYTPLARLFLEQNPNCQRPGCEAPATEVHHWAGRRSNYLRVETWRASCHECNMRAKNEPVWARSLGWLAPVGVYLT